MEKQSFESMYLLLKLVVFQLVMLVLADVIHLAFTWWILWMRFEKAPDWQNNFGFKSHVSRCLNIQKPPAIKQTANSGLLMNINIIPRCADWEWNIYLHEGSKNGWNGGVKWLNFGGTENQLGPGSP